MYGNNILVPNDNDIPAMINAFRIDLNEAGKLVWAINSLANCVGVCFHNCEGEKGCVLGIKQTPVQIHKIERYIAENTVDDPVTADPSSAAISS